jgi:hypothetical protein
MSVRLKPACPPKSVPLAQGQTESIVLVATETTAVAASPALVEQAVMVPSPNVTMMTPMKDGSNFMAKNYFWVYLLIVVIVLIIIFWYSCSCCRNEEFEKLHG